MMPTWRKLLGGLCFSVPLVIGGLCAHLRRCHVWLAPFLLFEKYGDKLLGAAGCTIQLMRSNAASSGNWLRDRFETRC
jgi:hypothetical protein